MNQYHIDDCLQGIEQQTFQYIDTKYIIEADMADCREAILSEAYADFLVEEGFQEQSFQERFNEYCIQEMDYKYNTIYAPRTESEPISLEKYPYSCVPKLFGLMDTSAAEATGALRLQKRAGFGLTGRGVIVGFIDSGIDYTNPVFTDEFGRSRILSIWDQTIQSGTTPQGIAYGSEYTMQDINEALQAANPLELVPSVDTEGHGTFLAGIACGSEDVENDFVGTANESLIAMVKLKPAKQYLKDFFLIENQENSVYQENDIMMAVSYLVSLAKREGRPLVLVIALGSGNGERTGGSVLSQMLDYYGEKIGNCVVVCSGNEGNERLHYEGNLTGKSYDDIELRVGENTRGFSLEIWGNIPDILSVEFIAPSGEFLPRIPARLGISTLVRLLLEETTIEVHYSLVEGRTGMELIFLRFTAPTLGVWTIRVYGSNVLQGQYNVWLPIRQFINENTYFLKPEPDITIVTPAASDAVITVAAYNHTNNALYTESGRGFTRIGAVKPDVAGPGVEVFGPGLRGNYVRKSGTSVSAALVAGNCAQLMQWGIVQGNIPQMKTNYIKNFLILGAGRDRNITYPSKAWGYGKVNLYETFRILTRG